MFLLTVPVVVFGTETVTHVLFVAIHVLFCIIPVIVDTVFVIELIVGRRSQLLLRICIPDHESCDCNVFFNSFHFT